MTNAGAWARPRRLRVALGWNSPQRLFRSDLSGGSCVAPFRTAASEPNACTASCTAGISLERAGAAPRRLGRAASSTIACADHRAV